MKGRYTISRHENSSGAHYDLFLESGETLSTWRLSSPPETGSVTAERIGDHRKAYLDYEGGISGGRGHVVPHSRGRYDLQGDTLLLEKGPSAGVYEFQEQNLLVRRSG